MSLYISKDSVKILEENQLPRVRIVLNYSSSQTEVVDLERMGKLLEENTNLKELELSIRSRNYLELEYLLEAGIKNKNLKTLIIEGNRFQSPPKTQISDEFINQLFQLLSQNNTLENLHFNEINLNPNIYLISKYLKKNISSISGLYLTKCSIRDDGSKYISQILQKNTKIKRLDLQFNSIDVDGAKQISEALKVNTILEELNLGQNILGDKGFDYIFRALNVNKTLSKLSFKSLTLNLTKYQRLGQYLKNNKDLKILDLTATFRDNEKFKYIYDGLKVNNTLTTLILDISSHNNDLSMRYLGEILATNKSLKKLSLHYNDLDASNIIYITHSLMKNNTLTTLDLNSNHLRSQGCQFIAEVLKINNTITTLDIGHNEIGIKGYYYICNALKINKSLKRLGLNWNKIDKNGCGYIADVLAVNNTLEELYLQNTDIDKCLEGHKLLYTALEKNYVITKMIFWEEYEYSSIPLETREIFYKLLERNSCRKNFIDWLYSMKMASKFLPLELRMMIWEKIKRPRLSLEKYVRIFHNDYVNSISLL